MEKYLFKAQDIRNDYKYIFLCGSKFNSKNLFDKRNVLSKYLTDIQPNYKPIILEKYFGFAKENSKILSYDDIYMKDLYQVEMLVNYLSDNNIIIHESISTGAEAGLFLSEKNALRKTCLLIPDKIAVEEDKLGAFLKLAFQNENSYLEHQVSIITFYPRIEQQVISENVKYWHTYFYQDQIGENLKKQILSFIEESSIKYRLKFCRYKEGSEQNVIYYHRENKTMKVLAPPRILMCCVAALFNIPEVASRTFTSRKRQLNEYINYLTSVLKEIFTSTIVEEEGVKSFENIKICPDINVDRVSISEFIGMSLYMFQAAGFIEIVKDRNYTENKLVQIKRKILKNSDDSESLFYEKYKSLLSPIIKSKIL